MKSLKLLILFLGLTVSGYGQLTQSWKNGYVAATDSGVWYLQDGFQEWVSIDVKSKGLYEANFGDTCMAISCNNKNVDGLYFSETGNYNYLYPIRPFGKYFYNEYPVHVSNYPETYIHFSNKLSSPLDYILFWDIKALGHFYEISLNDHTDYNNGYAEETVTCISTDNDSTVVSVGTDNTARFYRITNVGSYSSSVISGLHSNASHAHQIAYNPDDDYFLIVSDSGIVYKYDKSMVTTLDTLPEDSDDEYPVDTIYDIHYSDVDNVFIIATGQTNGQLNFYIWNDELITEINSDIESTHSLVSGDNKGNIMLCTSESIVVFDLLAYINEEEGNYYEYTDLIDRTIYDLDYINYLPYECSDGYAMIGDSCYETITIGTQTWLVDNLYYDDNEGDIYSYDDNSANSLIYGYLYTWDAAMRVDALIAGWHIPTNDERDALITYLSTEGGSKLAGEYDLWNAGVMRSSVNFDQTGFNAIPAGLISEYLSSGLGEHTTFWTSTEDLILPSAGIFRINYNDKEIYSSDTFAKEYKFSVRLIKD